MGNIGDNIFQQDQNKPKLNNEKQKHQNPKPQQKVKPSTERLPPQRVPAKCQFVYIHPKLNDCQQGCTEEINSTKHAKSRKILSQKQTQEDQKGKDEKINIEDKSSEKSQIGRILVQRSSFTKIKKKNYLDDYIHVKDIGQGSYGKVSKIKMKYTGLFRAAKIIQCSLLDQKEKEKEKVFCEITIPMKLDHPNLNKLYEVFQWRDKLILIMDLCQGGDLFNFIKTSGVFSEKKVAEIMKQILSAIVYMHNNKTVHRDLKPENILYEKNLGLLKIIDFGTAAEFTPNQYMTKLVGSLYYLAPEIIKGKYNQKCDVWSCGVILYVLLCGSPPFYSSKESEVMKKILNDPLQFKGSIWKKRSKQVKQLITQMLNKDRKQRISAFEAYNSSWLINASNEQEKDIEIQFLGNLSTFHFKNKLKAVVYTYIASQLYSDEDKERLLKAFREFDKDGNGVIEKHELMKIFQEYKGRTFSEAEAEKIIQLVDTNDSGLIDFTQFLVAASNQEELLKRERLQNAFSYLDTDRNGYITINEIKTFLYDEEESNNELKSIFDEVDQNGDGKISKKEFLALLTNKRA